ncbi:fimbria/pilus outer membrane usher protein [Salmonella enterica subsp. enterica]|nr:fimbria/pilus outer membrane usher protein [Salmonella enterica subsp. enterica]
MPRNYNNHAGRLRRATLLYGLPWGITLYGGQPDCRRDKPPVRRLRRPGKICECWGHFPLDGIWSRINLSDGRKIGQSGASATAKGRRQYGHHVFMAGYRYASETQFAERGDQRTTIFMITRQTPPIVSASVGQQSKRTLGSLATKLGKEDYWHSARQMESLSASYNNNWGPH